MFHDRQDAGEQLGTMLGRQQWTHPLVLGVARGGLPVAAAVADALGAELDVTVGRKVGAPDQPELGIAAVTANGPVVGRAGTPRELGMTSEDFERACAAEREEARRREDRYRVGPVPSREGRDVLVVDDGLATGVTAVAVLRAERLRGPSRLVLTTPTCAPGVVEALRDEADDIVTVERPSDFRAVGEQYARFDQLTDDDVVTILTGHRG